MVQNSLAARLNKITYAFPNRTEQEQAWNLTFARLLEGLQGHDRHAFQPSPPHALPLTAFCSDDAPFPRIVLDTTEPIHVQFGNIAVSNEPAFTGAALGVGLEQGTEMADGPSGSQTALSVSALYTRLHRHVIDIDHTGINIPIKKLGKPEWDSLMHSLSQVTNLYRYPGEAWPFIIPATEPEFEQDITDFTAIRTPKFEWVYDAYTPLPLFQFAIVTDLTREELEALFPAPYGFAIPGLDAIFRCVRLDSPWRESLDIRIDLYYKRDEGGPTDWETGEWLVTKGGRIRSS